VIALWRSHDALDHDELLGAARVKVGRLPRLWTCDIRISSLNN